MSRTSTATSDAASDVDRRFSRRFATAAKVDDDIHRQRARFNFNALRPWVTEGASLLDLGAGDGLLVSMLAADTGGTARGFDIEPRQLGDFTVEVYDGRHLPVADQSADICLCVAVLHHCEDAGQVLREIRRITRSRFLLIEDRFDSWRDRVGVIGFHHYLRLVENMPFDPRGFRSTSQWRRRLEEAGFEIEQVHTLGRAVRWFPIVNTLFVCQPR